MPWAKSFCPFRACWVITTIQVGRAASKSFSLFGAFQPYSSSKFNIIFSIPTSTSPKEAYNEKKTKKY